MKYIPKEKTIRKRKFTDKDFLCSYHLGLSDNKISKSFDCSSGAVRIRRIRLGLPANFPNFSGKKLTGKDIKKEEIRIQNITAKLNKKQEYKDRAIKWNKENKDYTNKYNKKYIRIPEVKVKMRETLAEHRKTDKFKQRQRAWSKKWWKKEEVKIWDRLRKRNPENHPTILEIRKRLSNKFAETNKGVKRNE